MTGNQPHLFADTWPWGEPTRPPVKPRCYRCQRPALPDTDYYALQHTPEGATA